MRARTAPPSLREALAADPPISSSLPRRRATEVDEQRLCYYQLDEQSRRLFEEPRPIIKDEDDRYLMVSPLQAAEWRELHAKRDKQGLPARAVGDVDADGPLADAAAEHRADGAPGQAREG